MEIKMSWNRQNNFKEKQSWRAHKCFWSPIAVCVWLRGRFLHITKQFYGILCGCPTVQLSSDTIFPKIASDSTGEELSSTRLHPLSHFIRLSQVQAVTWTSEQQAVVWKIQGPLHWIQLICWRGSQNLEKQLTYYITGLL